MAGDFRNVSVSNSSKLSAIALIVAFFVSLSFALAGCSGSPNKASAATAPVVSALAPNQASAATAIKISGSNFGTTQTATDVVTFNGKPATIISWSPTAIVTQVPAGASTGNVVISASGLVSNGV